MDWVCTHKKGKRTVILSGGIQKSELGPFFFLADLHSTDTALCPSLTGGTVSSRYSRQGENEKRGKLYTLHLTEIFFKKISSASAEESPAVAASLSPPTTGIRHSSSSSSIKSARRKSLLDLITRGGMLKYFFTFFEKYDGNYRWRRRRRRRRGCGCC